MKRVELLAPAGSFEAFKGAVRAGADAVYLGCTKYGARAYAENFTPEQVILALRYGHSQNVKIYLTLNTLMQERELMEVPSLIKPFYEAGLDGVIVQDLGALSLLCSDFPGMEVHASTQMSINTPAGAMLLRDLGVSRVVPSRELTLGEVKAICDTAICVEAFIHGAMCYSFSGRCLMSSMIGGRSGNRGRCAQPCRLSYELLGDDKASDSAANEAGHLLSLKDLCTVSILPELLEAGIGSLKIEGRMKKPEYSAGVTAIYRRALDDYYEKGDILNPRSYLKDLKKLYIRTDTGTGYYKGDRGRAMLTLDSPGYEQVDKAYLKTVRDRYLRDEGGKALGSKYAKGTDITGADAQGSIRAKRKIPISMELTFRADMPVCLKISSPSDSAFVLHKEGLPMKAEKRALTREDFEKHLSALGETDFALESLSLDMDEDLFWPVGSIKSLRREGIKKLTAELSSNKDCAPSTDNGALESFPVPAPKGSAPSTDDSAPKPGPTPAKKGKVFAISVDLESQLIALSKSRILKKTDRVYLTSELLTKPELKPVIARLRESGVLIFTAFPEVLKGYGEAELENILSHNTDGFLVKDMDSLACALRANSPSAALDGECNIVGDASLYCWNSRAGSLLRRLSVAPASPLELSKEQQEELSIGEAEYFVYGRIPLMVSHNCVNLSAGSCAKRPGYSYLRDRTGAVLPVRLNCGHCHNVIYSEQPLSLHGYSRSLVRKVPGSLRLSFTDETPSMLEAVLDYYDGIFYNEDARICENNNNKSGFPVDFFTGNYKRPVL